MKTSRLFMIALGMLATLNLGAQVSINTTGNTADSSAMLDVQSTTRGMLTPRMTTAQRDAIADPATGLIIYNLDNSGFQSWNGTVWANIAGPWEQTGDTIYYNAGRIGIGTDAPQAELSLAGGNFLQTPADPKHLGAIFDDGTTLLGGPTNIWISGQYAYVTSFDEDALTIVDVSDPANPLQIGTTTGGATLLDDPEGLYVLGDYAYVGCYDKIAVVDISDPTNPNVVGSLADDGSTTLMSVADISVSGKYAYATSFIENSVAVLDISDPSNPIQVGSITDDGSTTLAGAYSIYVSGKYAYVTAFVENGVSILDISDPTNPFEIGAISDD
ncbi:MAG: hypothetical protein R3301_07275, partial [Saprospiraceae bacterium]|nr:hypothetical protein [Saprospiraceae bacterium]